MSWKKGQEFERIAEEYLQKQGYCILERNWHAGLYGELDLICQKNDLLLFVEVKGRSSSKAYEDGLNSINHKKAKRLFNSMQDYLQKTEISGDANHSKIRLDLIVISSFDKTLEHIEDINLWDLIN
jgi:putative endonuclease